VPIAGQKFRRYLMDIGKFLRYSKLYFLFYGFLAEPWFVNTGLSLSIQFSKEIGKYDFDFAALVIRKVRGLITNVG
jgi:membrane-anchored glycerophosphoryl diester phosphodiesterase (GDPDase)